jgi:hypothetical protein
VSIDIDWQIKVINERGGREERKTGRKEGQTKGNGGKTGEEKEKER